MLANLSDKVGPQNDSDRSPLYKVFDGRDAFIILPRLALQELPVEWQVRFVALMEEAEALGVETPGFSVQRRGAKGRMVRFSHWCNYRRGTLREAMAIEEESKRC